jgi:hypothetical protein
MDAHTRDITLRAYLKQMWERLEQAISIVGRLRINHSATELPKWAQWRIYRALKFD